MNISFESNEFFEASEIVDNFNKWFGNSVIFDKDINPLVVYHGTRFSFDEFSHDKLGANVKNPTTSLGHYFTDSREGADRWKDYNGFATRTKTDTRVMEVYLALENPLYISNSKFDYMLRSARKSTINQFKEKAVNAGYDGLRISYENEGAEWFVAFHPWQIKSAHSNCGAFSRDDPSISDRQTIDYFNDLKNSSQQGKKLRP